MRKVVVPLALLSGIFADGFLLPVLVQRMHPELIDGNTVKAMLCGWTMSV
jgi:hypothetical protein